jgi:hypothetical protein
MRDRAREPLAEGDFNGWSLLTSLGRCLELCACDREVAMTTDTLLASRQLWTTQAGTRARLARSRTHTEGTGMGSRRAGCRERESGTLRAGGLIEQANDAAALATALVEQRKPGRGAGPRSVSVGRWGADD